MTKNYISILVLAFLSAFSINQLSAQEEKSEVKVVVIEKTIDKDGKETVTKVIKEGKDATVFIQEIKEGEHKKVGKKHKTKSKKVIVSGDGEQKVMIIKSDGDNEERVIKWKGDGELPEDMKELLEEHNISIDVDAEGEHNIRVKVISDGDEEESIIFIDEDYEISEGGDIEVIVHKSHDSRKAQLGVMIQEVEGEAGIEVTDVFEDSGAEKAGIRKGDIITKVDDTEVSSIDELINSVKDRNPGDEVKLKVVRDKEPMIKKVTLQEFSYKADHDKHENREVIIIKEKH